MIVREGQLRRIIREELLREVAKGPEDLPPGTKFIFTRYGDNEIELDVKSPGNPMMGKLKITKSYEGCEGAWEVSLSNALVRGLGPLMYDAMMEYIHPDGMMSDRYSVTDDARRVWRHYYDSRPDVDHLQLDNLRGELTPDYEEDDCEQHSANKDRADGPHTGRWQQSPLSKMYSKPGDAVLGKLYSLGMLVRRRG
jgi:hypothetical protein